MKNQAEWIHLHQQIWNIVQNFYTLLYVWKKKPKDIKN